LCPEAEPKSVRANSIRRASVGVTAEARQTKLVSQVSITRPRGARTER
jgi:hypothetical protein